MARRISLANLNSVLERIAELLPDHTFKISRQCGGYALYRIVTPKGSAQDVFSAGHIPARELHAAMCAYLQGLEDMKMSLKSFREE